MIRTLAALVAAATLAACASSPDQVAGTRTEKQYRTGSNIAVRDGDMPGPEQSVKPDTVPIFKGPGPKVGPTGAGGG